MTRIIGIDPGLANIGWGVIEQDRDKLQRIRSGIITTSSKLPEEQRLHQLADHLKDIIRDTGPKVLAYEKTFYNKPTMAGVYKATGAIVLTAMQMGIVTCSYQPQQIKQAVTGSRSADKRYMKTYVCSILGSLNGAGEHEVDALAVAITRAHSGWYEELEERVYS